MCLEPPYRVCRELRSAQLMHGDMRWVRAKEKAVNDARLFLCQGEKLLALWPTQFVDETVELIKRTELDRELALLSALRTLLHMDLDLRREQI